MNEVGVNLRALSAILNPLRRPIVTARSEREALELASRQRFAVILIDVVASERDAFEMVDKVRALSQVRRLPVVLLTARNPTGARLNAIQRTGLVDYVLKPFPPELLRSKIAALISLEVHERIVRAYEEALAAKDRTIAMLAHDLQNPISAIRLASETLSRRRASRRFRDQVQSVSRMATRVAQMVHDLMDYGRAGQGRLPTTRTPLNVGDLCGEVVAEFRHTDPAATIVLRCRGDLGGAWDRERLHQALSNLVRNALRYGAGGVLVGATGRSDHVEISVHNDGSPIPRELLPKIFHPFQRGDHGGEGLGLGLFIVEQVVAAHGGDISVRSTAQSGTTFKLRLPRPDRRLGPRRFVKAPTSCARARLRLARLPAGGLRSPQISDQGAKASATPSGEHQVRSCTLEGWQPTASKERGRSNR